MAADIGVKVKIDGYAQFKSEISDITQQQKTLKSEMQAVSSAWDKNTSAEKKNADTKRILNQQIELQKQKVDQLKQATEQVAQKYGENSREAQSWKEKLNQATAELNNMQNQLKNLPSGIQELSNSFKESGEKITEVGDKIKGVGEGASKYITAPLAGLGAASIAAFNDVDSGLDTIISKTGASGDALASMQSSMEQIATTIPTEFGTAGAAVGEVNTRFGLMGDELTKVSGDFIKFAELNGTDVSGSIDKVQASMTAFGMSGSEASTVLDILNKAGQDTGISVDKLSQDIMSNSTALKEMGFDYNSAAGFIANLNKNGIDSSTVMTGMKKALQNATKEGKPLSQALQELQTNMANADSSTEAMQMAIDLFGSKAGPQLAAAISEGRISLDEAANAVTNFGDSVNTTFEATQDPPDKFKIAMNELKLTGSELGGTILETLTPALEKLSGLITDLRAAWEGLDPQTQQTIVTIGLVAAAIGPVLVIIGTVIGAIGSIVSAIGSVIGVIGAVVGVLGGPLTIAIAAAIAIGLLIVKNWDTIKAKAQELAGKIREKFNEIKEAIVNKFNEAKTKALEIWENIKSAVTEKVNALKAAVSSVVEGIKAAVTEKFNAAKQAATDAWEAAKSAVTEKVQAMKDKVSDTLQGIKDKVTEIMEGVKNAFKEKIDAAKELVHAGIEAIKGLFNITLEFPKIKLPHFKINGNFSLNPPSVPSFSVDWYAKAMKDGMILNNPTIFGMQGGRLLGAGEAGPEVVVGASSLFGMIKRAVGNTYNTGGNVINVYGAPGQDVKELAREIANLIQGDVDSKAAVWG